MLPPKALLLGLPLAMLASCGSGTEENPHSASSVPEQNAAPRHVLLIVIDTLRADHLSCYGYWRETSPNIDALAARGMLFTRAISQSSWTAPSMVTLMTSQRVSGARLHIPEDKPVLAELFKDAGFKTGAWVANELLEHKMGFSRGFDKFVDEKEWHSEKPAGRLDGILDWLAKNKDNDTFTWVHFTDPHDPYSPAGDLLSGQSGKLSQYQKTIIEKAARNAGALGDVDSQTAFIRDQVGRYDDEIRTVDRKVRKLLLALRENGNLDNAVVALTSDHGECLWERPESARRVELKSKNRGEPATVKHLLKQTHGDFVYQELVHVPLIIVAPSIAPGQTEDAVSEAVHLPATLLALAGVQVDGMQKFMGQNLFGPELPGGAYTMTSLGEAFIAESGWKLILPTESGSKEYAQPLQLYNLSEDPGELNNVAGEYPQRVADLSARIAQRRAGALPRLSQEELTRKALEVQGALDDLGYGGGDFMDVTGKNEQ